MSVSGSITQKNMENLRPMKNKIKIFRAMHDLTQEQLAQAIGVNRQTILAIEKEKYIPSLDLAFKISRYFGVNIEEVFVFDEKTPGIKDT
jgi:putative transcriptional regulator